MGRHRDDKRFRGVSVGLLVAVVALVVVGAGVFGWMQLGERIRNEGVQAAGACVEGELTLHVAADPAISPALARIGREFTDSEPVIRDHCVSVQVTAIGSDIAREALASEDGWSDELGPRPALWVPASSHDLRQIPVSTLANADPRSI
ncbi:MAG: ABC transporter substrate-binding protein, partial [Rhodococcus sp.]|nr:ABC transporter substrate-binding protein [Rhodococcus sp. (in: high G+C Gram-positive bacteria)]